MSNATQFIAYQQNAKSKGVAYALWFFFGGLGAHRFYMRSYGMAVALLGAWFVALLAIILHVPVVSVLCYLFIGIMMLLDIFLIPGIVSRHNMKLMLLLDDPKAMAEVEA